jgi:uncharacterized surface protein with fasciclin (FAS1) repeats
MGKNIFKSMFKAAGALLIPVSITMSSCSAEPDDSNLYTFTGQTIADFLAANDSAFSSFSYILQRSGYDRLLGTYGTYTCFAPDNQAVQEYIDSLYDDETNLKFVHNGMTEKSLEGLSDSLCADIAKFHLAGSEYMTVNLGTSGQSILSLLGRTIMTSINSNGLVTLNDGASITKEGKDIELENGVVQVLNHVIPRSNSLMTSELKKYAKFSLFTKALELTGLNDSLEAEKKDVTLDMPAKKDGYYRPTECKLGFTIFAETDEVLKANGIETLEDLIEHAKEWYENAATGTTSSSTAGWYDYYRNNGVKISTGTDYTSPYNVLNMYVRYHILKSALAKNVLALDFNTENKYGYNGDTYDYYETMLPKTLIKIWKVKKEGKTFINRYKRNNTLTDGLETMGSSDMHELVYEGAEIMTDSVAQALNGYIYPIHDILIYNSQVPHGVLNERMRFDALSLLPELMNNGYRGMNGNELTAIAGESASRLRFPVNFFDNVKVYNGHLTQIDMNVIQGDGTGNQFLLYKGDSFQGMGSYDLAIKLPPVPDGEYELRIDVTTFGTARGSMLQYYLGTSNDVTKMEAVDIPVDMRMSSYGPKTLNENVDARLTAIGCYSLLADDDIGKDAYADKGLSSDKEMRLHGYMRGPLSVTKNNADFNSRYAAYQLRRILVKRKFTQGDYWVRLKTVLPEVTEGKYQLDFIELVPVSVCDNNQYLEDMY